MFNLGIEAVKRFDEIAFYGHLWLVEFRDYTQAIVIEDRDGAIDEPNFVLTPNEVVEG
jgi:hypothetical protein